jgi:Amt family ammonium transporter
LGAASGDVAGLVAITPAAGFVSPVSAILIGLVAGVICYLAVLLKGKLRYDDALDVVAVHGIGGLWGALATGLLASTAWNPGGADGLFFGNPKLFAVQLYGAVATIAYSMIVTYLILKLIDVIVGLRVDRNSEVRGLDLTEHSEAGYTI